MYAKTASMKDNEGKSLIKWKVTKPRKANKPLCNKALSQRSLSATSVAGTNRNDTTTRDCDLNLKVHA